MRPASYRVHRQSAATLSWQPTDSEGELATATGTPTVAVTDAQGDAVTVADTPAVASGAVTLDLTAAELADVDRWTITWSLDAVERGQSTVDIVGGVYLTVADVRSLEPSLSDATEYPTATVQRCRREVESRFERSVLAVAFVPRLSVHRFTGSSYATVSLPHYFVTEVRWARYWSAGAWVSLDVSEAVVSDTGVVRLGPECAPYGSHVEVGYVHGLTSPPEDVKRAAALAVRHQALQNRSGIDSRAMSYQPSEGGNVVLATAGVGPWEFGVPDIDGVLRSWREQYLPVLVA
jgi:hypothetical protein